TGLVYRHPAGVIRVESEDYAGGVLGQPAESSDSTPATGQWSKTRREARPSRASATRVRMIAAARNPRRMNGSDPRPTWSSAIAPTNAPPPIPMLKAVV